MNNTPMSTKSETDVAYTKGYAHGFLIATDTFQEILEKSSKDVKTLHNRSDIDREMKTYDFNEIIRDEELTNE